MTVPIDRPLPSPAPRRAIRYPWQAASGVVLAVSAGTVGLLSYGCALLMAHLLPPGDYGRFAAIAMLLTVIGTTAAALIPLPLAHRLRRYGRGSEERIRSTTFAVLVALAAGSVAACAAGAMTLVFAGPGTALATAVSALAVFAIAPVWGHLQGESLFRRYAVATVAEAALRLCFSVLAVSVGWGVAGAAGGFAVGATLVLAVGAFALRHDLRWRPNVVRERERWAETGSVALTQLVLSALVATDVLLLALVGDSSTAAAGYQAVSTLSKAPVYLAAGTVIVLFPVLRLGTSAALETLRSALGTFVRVSLTAFVVLATVPPSLAAILLPEPYVPALTWLPWLAVAGLGHGVVIVMTIVLLALGHGRRSRTGLAAATTLVAVGLVGGHAVAGIPGLAVGGAVGSLAAAACLVLFAVPVLGAGLMYESLPRAWVAAFVLLTAILTRPEPLLWTVAVAVAVIGVLLRGRDGVPAGLPVGDTQQGGGRLRILHLGFEDHATPGSGGGSRRTYEIGRRIARRHELTILVQRFPGCVDRVEDGIHYVHVGPGRGRTRLTRLLGYLVGLPREVRRRSADLVVEDFFAPISSMAAPLWTGRPTIGLVQWLNAEEKAAQFHLPVHLVERFGVRRHRHLIAVSDGIRDKLLSIAPSLTVDVVGNGVAAEAFVPKLRIGSDVLFVGRLEIAQKGLDMLVEAWARASRELPCSLLVAGTGPDEQRLRRRVEAAGIGDRVRFVGWVSGRDKYELMARARLVAVPSRFETFGIVAVEAAATGTPVVAFDIPCLREVVPGECGRLVTAFDVDAYAAALVAAWHDARLVHDDAPRRRAFAAHYDWDVLSSRQEQIYRDAAAAAKERVR